MGLFNIFFELVISAAAIVVAGTLLTRFTDQIAEMTGWGRQFAGGLILAGATSLPELMVDLKAIQVDLPDLAAGDLLGSSLMNLMVLAILDFSYPSAFRRTAFSPNFLKHTLSAVLTILLTGIVGIAILTPNLPLLLNVNVACWAVGLVYIWGLRLIFLERDEPQNVYETKRANRQRFAVVISGYLLSATIIFVAAPYFIHSADLVAKELRIEHSFVGTTLVALATSLPELVATLAAFRMGAPDLALGNIFGSNAFNMILFIPLDFMFVGDLFSAIRSEHALTAIGIIVATSIAVLGQLYRKKERSRFAEPSSELVLIVCLTFIFLIFRLS